MVKIKVQGGTLKGGTGTLCSTCSNGTVIRGDTRIYTSCSIIRKPIEFPVKDCTGFYHTSLPSLYEMKEIAWPLATDKKGRRVGFMSPQEFDRRREDLAPQPIVVDYD